MAALFLRRALRVTLTLATAAIAGVAAHSWAASDTFDQSGDIQPVAASVAPPRIVGQESRLGRPVALGSRIASGPGSGLKFTLNDRSTVIIGPNSAISVDEFAADRVVLRLERGSFYVDSANPGSLYLVLPTGTVTVKASTVAGRIGPNGTEIALLSVGRAEVMGFGGYGVRLDQPGEATRIIGLGAPTQPSLLSPQRLQDYVGLAGQVALLQH
ncbi:FecR family protein [uncultured Ferrovibrio sp.]|jgi:ferric-dicitrate binding protein FerR (iron transport regulator)|uniref:FecR family protein n=1 Tax=uncultured Ferrovibrio sp. TaxID=1576913 RepID=UPI0026071DF8|nr:FecR family protein [uncultured Ferrovibrio sp.]